MAMMMVCYLWTMMATTAAILAAQKGILGRESVVHTVRRKAKVLVSRLGPIYAP